MHLSSEHCKNITCTTVNIRFAKPIEVGSSNEEIEISITVRNDGKLAEDAYETMLYVELPEGVLYSGITNANAVRQIYFFLLSFTDIC